MRRRQASFVAYPLDELRDTFTKVKYFQLRFSAFGILLERVNPFRLWSKGTSGFLLNQKAYGILA